MSLDPLMPPPEPRQADPTPQDLADPLFEAVWTAIKAWDIQRTPGRGYAGATGTDVMTILTVVQPFLTAERVRTLEEAVEIAEVERTKPKILAGLKAAALRRLGTP